MKKGLKWVGMLLVFTPLGTATVIGVLYLVKLLLNV